MDNNKKPLWNLWNSLRQDNYDVPDDYESFEETLTAPGQEGVNNRQALYHSLRQDNYDVPDTYENFSTTLFAPVQQQAATGVAAQGTSQQRRPEPGERIEATHVDNDGNVLQTDTTQLVRGKVATVEIGTPQFTPPSSEEGEELARRYGVYNTKESLTTDFSYRPNEYGEMPFGWGNGQRIKQLNRKGLEFMNRTGGYDESYDQAAAHAEQMSDAQLVAEFNKLSGQIGDAGALANTPDGYAMATALRAYSHELRARDIGFAHGSENKKGIGQYQAAKQDPAVAAEILKQEAMSPEQRKAYLANAYKHIMAGEEGAPDIAMLAGTMIHAKESGIFPEEAYSQVVGIINNEHAEDVLAGALQSADAEIERLSQLIEQRTQQLYAEDEAEGMSLAKVMQHAESGSGAPIFNQRLLNDPELSMLWTAKRAAERRKKVIERKQDNHGFMRQFIGTFWDTATDINTWDFGIQDMRDAVNLASFSGNESLSVPMERAREAMLQNTVDAQEAEQRWKLSAAQRWGVIGGQALPFVAEFIGTGGGFSGVRQGVTKGVTSFLEKSLGKAASSKAAQWLVRSTGMLTGDIASALLMANTTGSMKTYADILDRKTGDLMQLYDGTFVYRNSTTMGDAILKGEVANTLEYYTEMLGNHLDGLISGAGKRLGLSRLSESIKWLTGRQIQQLTTNVLRQGGINELPSEILEEEANLILNAMLVGDNNFDTGPLKGLANKFGCNFEVDPNSEDYQRSIFNPETQADIWGGMLFSIGAMRAPSVVIGTAGQGVEAAKYGWNAANYYYYKHKTDLAGTKLNGLVGGDELLDRINNTTNEQIPSLVAGILADDDFTPDMKSLAMDYIGNLVKERGYNVRMFDNAKDLDPEQDQEEGETVDLSYQEGYNAADEEQAGVKERVDVARAWLYNLGFDDSNIESLSGEQPEAWLAALSDEQREAVEEYTNAQAAYEGMLQHVQDDMEGAIAESEATVEQRTHPDTGAVHRAELKTGGEVFIISGNVALMPDNSIDIENSDGDLIVFDPATGDKRMIHISDLASADEPVMADQLKEEAATTIQETMATDASNRIDGVLPFQPGDVYSDLPFGDETHTVQVIADGEDGVNVVVSVDGGEQQLMPMQMIQEAADAQREARIAEQAAVAATAAQPQPTGQENAAPADDEASQSDAIPEQEAVEEGQPDEDAMPMNGDEVDWFATSPERGHRFLYDEAGLSPEEADAVVANSVKDAEKELEKVSKKAPKPGNAAQLNKYRAEKAAHEQQVAAAQAAVDYWKGVQATQEAIRQQAEAELLAQRAEEGKQRSEAAAQTEAEKEAQRLADREAARQEREALNGVPDVVNDKPEDARARGFRNVNGERVDRQLLTNSVGGRTGSVKFSTDVTVPSRIAVIEADELQPSHIEGQRNPLFFLDEAQPKNRTDQASDVAAEKIAKNINPEEITGDGGAYQFSAPTVNERGEVVQGNNRSSALKRMWSSGAYADSQQRYKQYLIDHAEEFGLNPQLVASMNRPVMVNEISVDDAEAIRLGQMSAKDLESGGIERIDPVTTARKLGPKMRNFASVLLSGEDENMSLAELIAANGEAAVKWLADRGVISPTQVQSAWNPAKTGLTAEAKLDLQNILRQQLFQGGVSDLPHMFEAMPAKAQKAILSTFMRDMDSADADRILPEIQHAIEAWYGAASGTSDFSKATNYEAASRAMLGWTNVRNAFSGVLPSEKFSKFAIELANRLQGSSMRNMVTYLNEFYDLVQGTGVGDLFGSGVSGEKLTLAEAIAKIFNVDINETNNGQERSEDVGSDRGDGQEGRQGEPGDAAGTEPATPGAGTSERGGRAESNDQSVAQAEAEVDTEPTEGQKEAGNYKKGHVKIDGFDVTIEQPKGSVRSGVDASGKAWSQEMHNTYGYIRGTEGVDGDHIDVFLSDHLDSWNGMVYVVDQVNKDGSFDEHKVMYGFDSEQEARDAYLSNYEEGWTGLGNITGVTRDEFKKWVDSSHRKTKPFAEYKSVRATGSQYTDNTSRPIQGLEGYSEQEILDDVRAFIEQQLEDAGIEGVTIKGMALHGSRMRGDARPDSDLDVVVEYEGDISEDAFFNLVNYDLNFRGPNGVIIDINPITRGKSGTLEQYMERSRRYDGEKRAAAAEATEPVQSTDTGDQAYTITPTKYTTKKNKELDVWLVKFSGEIDKKQATEIAKETRGWWDREQGGFLMRSEEAARDLAERVAGATSQSDAIPEQPAAGNKPAETGNKPANTRKKSGKRSAYVEQQIDAIARELATRDVVRGTIETMPRIEDMMAPFSDWVGQYVAEHYSDMENPDHVAVLHEFFGHREWSPKENTDRTFKALSDVIKRTKEVVKQNNQAQAAASENASKPASEEPAQSTGTDNQATTNQAGPKRLVSDDRMAELKERLRKKLGGQLNVGVDPELLAIGAELAVGHIERGLTKFADYAKAMLEDVGDVIRPYLKSFYNAVRDMPEAEAYTAELTPYDEVRKFDVANFDKEGPKDVIATAKSIVEEQKVEKDALDAKKTQDESEGKQLRPATQEDIESGKTVYHNGEPHRVMMIVHHGEQVGPTQFSKPEIKRVYLDNGKDVSPDELFVMDDKPTGSASPEDVQAIKDILQPEKKGKKSGKKKGEPSSQQGTVPSLFGDTLDQEHEADEIAEATKPKTEKPKPAKELAGDSADHQEIAKQEADFVAVVSSQIIHRANAFLRGEPSEALKMADVKRMLQDYPRLADYSTTDLQELVELAMTMVTRNTALISIRGDADEQRKGYAKVVAQYMMQPLLNARDSTRIERQQYSTPTPFGYVMGQFLQAGRRVDNMLEPSAGNGALTITFQPRKVHVNDIDERRLANLRTLGYGRVTSQNGLLPFEGEQYDTVGTNPPFGSIAEREYDGGIFRMTSLEGQMAINALDAMKDNGRAAIIIGGNTEYRDNGVMKAKDMAFFSYLYSHYNVVDVINIDGAMYSRNGTKFPERIILVDGRKPHERPFTAADRVVPPVKAKARAEQVKTFDELYNRVQDDILQIQQNGQKPADTDRPAGTPDRAAGTPERVVTDRPGAGVRGGSVPSSKVDESRPAQLSSVPAERPERGSDVRPSVESSLTGVDHEHGGNAGRPTVDAGSRTPAARTGTRERGDGVQAGGGRTADSAGSVNRPVDNRGRLSIGDEKVAYPNRSQSGTLMSVVPANQADAITTSLSEIGDVDQFLVDELGYSSKDELYSYLAAEQIDSVALAITQMNRGKGFIIGDMTGVGKGRQGAALIRYAINHGKVPIYFTQKSSLFSDNYRDLADIGSGGLRPFIIGSSTDANITDANGNIVHRLPSKKEQERVFDYIKQHGVLPEEYDYVITTYSQIQTGLVDYEAKGDSIVETAKKGKRANPNAAAKSGQRKRDALARLAEGNMAILDESHTVGGDGGGAMFMQYLMQKVGGVTFLSATFAKRADNMPVYAMKTDISECGVSADEMIQAIQKGGVTLQEIMSKQLVQSGQMIRRERSFQGVTIDWMPVSDEQSAVQHRQFDEVSSIFSAIRAFQDDYVKPVIEDISDEIAEAGQYAQVTQGTEAMGVRNVPFASKMYNLVNQLLFALKADAVADRVIWNLEQGYKPVISFTNTMEGFLGELPRDEVMDEMPNFSLTLLRALDGVLRYTTKDMDQNSEGLSVPLSKLSDEGRAKYNEIRQRIMDLSADLPISPMDAIRIKLERAGYKVGEITGRQTELAQTDDGQYIVRTRSEKDKKAAARGFNDGSIDVLMINKSGSTGISLHSSTKFKDQRQRVMVFAQFQSDINDEVQMRGRIDRTGQVSRGKYEYIVSTIPAEQRLQMMFKSKLKSLDANTTSSQKSKFNEMQVVDFLNKYGDEVVWEYMSEHAELEEKLGDPLNMLAKEGDQDKEKKGSRFGSSDNKAGCAAKIARYLPFLPVAEQEEVFRDITEAYAVKIQLLNDAGENDLEITTMPLRAATKSRKVWKEGVAPDSGNAFADNTYLEEVEVDVLRKPMKATEIRAYSDRLSEGKPFEQWKQDKLEEIRQHIREKAEATIERITRQAEERAAKKRAKFIDQARKYREQGKNAFTDQEIDNLAKMEYDTVMQELEKRVEAQKRQASAKYNAISAKLDLFTPLRPLIIPVNLKDNTGSFVPSFGTFVGFKLNRDYSMSASTAVFATLDGRRKVELPLNSETEFAVIRSQSQMQNYALRDVSMDNWDTKVPTTNRKTAYIVTGNLLQALVDIQKNEGSARGQLITYSTIDGDVRQGILMPDNFTPTDLKQSVGINKMYYRIRSGEMVISSDGEVEVMNYGAYGYRLNVPKSTSRGQKYFGNKKLLNIVRDGEFETRGGQMVATFDEGDLKKVLDILTKDLNVTVLVSSDLKDAKSSVRGETAQYNDRSGAGTAIEGDEVLFRELDDEEDAELIAELESGSTVTTYSTKVKVDGGYIPPMSSKDNETGKMRKPEREGTWNEAEERPDMAYFDEKSGKWKFDLKKSNNKTTGHVDYNPYGHSGSGMLNDQFSEAQSRPDLVVVEMAVPESEVTSGYKAEKANDPVGWKPWKAGPITAKMTGTRQVMLSRWHKITREVPWPEVAQSVARDLGNQFDVLPTNTFPVQLRAELEKLGYQFIETNNKGVIQEGPYKGLTWTDRYYDINPELDKRKDRKKRAAHTAAVVRANSAQYTDNAEARLREALVEGGRLAIINQGGKWRIEGMPGEFGSRYAAIDEWRERAAGNVVWYMSEDGNHIEVEGNGDMYEMMSLDTTTSGRKQRERLARQQATRSASGRRMVDELADKLGVKVRYVEDMSEQERAQFSERQLRSKGWYNPRTGEVFINLGRHTRLYDILSTFLHETVAHKGLRRLFGKDFNTFLDNVYNNVNKGIRAEIGRMAEQQKSRASEAQRARHDDEHWRRVATEEYMAKLAERLNLNHPEERTIWEKIKGFLLDKLRKIGVTVADSLSDNDLRGILWESYHSMESEGVMGYAQGVAFRDQMEREANNRGTATAHGTNTIAAEPQGQYTGSLFDMLPQAGAWARMMSNMSERELRNEIAKDGPSVTSSYSEEYDRRHIREYNQACDEIQAQLDRDMPGEDRLLELLQDAKAQWADGAYKDERRTGVLAAIDTISRALDEERAELPRVEEDNLYRDDVDEVRKEVDDYISKYGGAEKVIINTPEDLANEYGLSTDEAQDGFEALKDRNTAAAFDHETGKIIIFVPNLLEGETEQSCFHEDFHAWLEKKYGKDVAREVCNRYLEAAKDKYPITYQSVKDSYEEKDHAEEFMAYRMEKSMASGLVEKGIYQYLNEEDRQLIDEFLETLHYDKERERAERKERRRKAVPEQASSGRRRDTEEGSQSSGRGAGLGRRLKEQLSGLPSEDDTDDVDVAGDGTIDEYNRAVNTMGKTMRVAGRDFKPRMTRYNFQEAFQDAILSVKKLQQVVCKAHGLDKLPSKEDAWTYENRLSSINMHARKHFIEKLYEPMMNAHDKLVKHGATVDEITEYVICKHGLERNQVFAERDAQRDADEIARNGGVPDIDALRDQYRQRDYSGLTSITGLDNIADIEADAQRRVDEFEQKHGQLCDELWSRINDATKWTLRRSYDGGMMSAQTYIKVRDMFQHYVPLRGWDETTVEDVYDYIMGDRGAFNGTLKTAMGRTSLADDPFATIGNMGESAIVQGNRNHLKQRLWNMATNHPTDVCKVRDMWVVLDAQGEWIADFPEIPEDADADTIAMILEDHETAMLDLESQDLAKRVRNNLDVGYRIDQRYIPEHAVVVMMNGDRHVVYINGNPRAAQAINGNLSSDKGSKNAIRRLVDFFFKDTRRYYSSVVTSYNINFSGANFVRDLPHAYAMTFTKYGWIKAAKYIVKSFQCIPWVIKNQAGYSGNSNMDQLFREFVAYGGVTGYAHINDIDSWKADNRRRMARLNALGKGTVGTLKGIKAVIHAVGWFSETLELIPRFTTYCASRDMGMDIQQSIKEAKDITTNFNKKGTEMTPGVWGAVANVLRYEEMFFNPIVQGMYQWFDVANDSKAAKARLVGVMLWMPAMGALIPYLNQFLLAAIGGDDDDDYFLQNEFTRRQNMLIWTGNGYAKIPIAPVFRELYGIGETIATRMCGRIDDRTMATDLVDQLRAAFSLEGQSSYREWSFARMAFPDHYGPIIDIMNNENFTGKSLWYESEWTKNKPEYTKAKESTWSPLVEASRKINGWLGGDDDIKADASGKWLNPVVWQHLLTNYGGGFAQVIGDASSTINNLAHGEPTDVSQWPIAKRFYTQPTEKRANWARYGIYKQYEVEFNKAKDKFSALKKRGLAPLEMAKEISEFAQRHPKAVGVYASWNGGINGADYVQKLKDLREKGDDAAYWATLKEAVEKADYAMRTGYARAWEQKRPSRPEFLDDDELRNTFDNSENDSVRAVMAKEIATRQGVQDYFSHDPYENYGDEAATYWNAYRRLRLSEDVVEDGKASMLLDDKEKEVLKKIKKQLGQGGDDEQIMDEYRRERRRLIEEHDNE